MLRGCASPGPARCGTTVVVVPPARFRKAAACCFWYDARDAVEGDNTDAGVTSGIPISLLPARKFCNRAFSCVFFCRSTFNEASYSTAFSFNSVTSSIARLRVLILETLSSPIISGYKSRRPVNKRRISSLRFLSVELCAHRTELTG